MLHFLQGQLPILAVLVPVAGAMAVLVLPRAAARWMQLFGFAGFVIGLAVAVDVYLLGPRELVLAGWSPPLGITLATSGTGALLVGVVSVLMFVCGISAAAERRSDTFTASWLLTWAALVVVFLANDAFTVYVALELLSIAAVSLVVRPDSQRALRAALSYLVAGLTGSLLYLLGVALLYAASGTLSFAGLGDTGAGPTAAVAIALMTAGILLKSAVFPLHGWLPGAHGNAPAAASAVLSGVVVKAGVFLLWRLWSEVLGDAGMPAGDTLLALLGVCALAWGSVMALRVHRLKLVIAYSTIAQMGYLVLVVPLLRADPITALPGVALLAANHAFAKAGGFLAAGCILAQRGRDGLESLHGLLQQMPVTAFALALSAIALVGLPPSGGFVGKWILIQSAYAAELWWWIPPFVLGGLLSAAALVRALSHGFIHEPQGGGSTNGIAVGASLQWAALMLALLALLIGMTAGYWVDLASIGLSAGRPLS
ncbi:MAG: oxidoreductase [Gammaproteobacteria bacterium]|nr:oxidoreductase [Gammaproteobacteria bacterium]